MLLCMLLCMVLMYGPYGAHGTGCEEKTLNFVLSIQEMREHLKQEVCVTGWLNVCS